MTKTQKQIVEKYIKTLVVDSEDLEFTEGSYSIRLDDGEVKKVDGLLVEDDCCLYGVVVDNEFFEGVDVRGMEDEVILEIQGEPTKISELL